MVKKKKVIKEAPLEKTLWLAADKLRKNIDAAEYKHIVLGLIFLKYISDAFEELYNNFIEHHGADFEKDEILLGEFKDECLAESVFYVPAIARWSHLKAEAKKPTIGRTVDDAMDAIEKENKTLKNVLPKQYARENLDKTSLGGLIDKFSNITIGDKESRAKDVLGKVYEYFLGQFALAEGKKGGQFYTPKSVVQLLVQMLEPYKGRVYDPCCGSGGMFVQSEEFILSHQGKIDDINIYGQESNQTTWRLAKMNLSIRGINSQHIKWNTEGSFLKDAHPDLKADYVIANPPFNDSDWSGSLLVKDGRWKYGIPPTSNANFAWLQHFIYHLAPNGKGGIVLAKGSLSTKSSNEGEIRKAMVKAGLIDCIVNLPTKLFLNTQIPACLWFFSRGKKERSGEVLFIDARNMGHLINRRNRELSDADIQLLADTFHHWKTKNKKYTDIQGFCKSATLAEINALDYVLTPGRYIGIADEEEAFDFTDRFNALKATLKEQMKKEARLNKEIEESLRKIIV
ncbi:type I restriction-modification system subunit M [Niabella pedocola]|uniref:site-specific DNA-methyltransferase (adenine-specific) n=1 Tax=Niabella pedocola TaxID=1752077 RepID=A0ABS8PV52_9BACT|nr:class I SAM-dependent DNA methyltransferase [Niabella pedocola]MCD2424940.1 type I restriction-modification system subunit M [Niabella pedocola]